MDFDRFIQTYQHTPLIESSTFPLVCDAPDHLRVYVTQWQRKGYLHRLRAGVYVLDEKYRKAPVSPLFVAGYLISPSYVSLEYALSHHGFIPERARTYTCVTTRHGRRFENVLGTFDYRHVKPALFFGYQPVEAGGQEALIADPEKALLDLFYLNGGRLEATAAQVEALRLQNLDQLDLDRLAEYAAPFTRKARKLARFVARAAGG